MKKTLRKKVVCLTMVLLALQNSIPISAKETENNTVIIDYRKSDTEIENNSFEKELPQEILEQADIVTTTDLKELEVADNILCQEIAYYVHDESLQSNDQSILYYNNGLPMATDMDSIDSEANIFAVFVDGSKEIYFQSFSSQADQYLESMICESLQEEESNELSQDIQVKIVKTLLSHEIDESTSLIFGEATTDITIVKLGFCDETQEYMYDVIENTSVNMQPTMEAYIGADVLFLETGIDFSGLNDISDTIGAQSLVAWGPESNEGFSIPEVSLSGYFPENAWTFSSESVHVDDYSSTSDAIFNTIITPRHSDVGSESIWETTSGARFGSKFEAYTAKFDNIISLGLGGGMIQVYFPLTRNISVENNTIGSVPSIDSITEIPEDKIIDAIRESDEKASIENLYTDEAYEIDVEKLAKTLIADKYYSFGSLEQAKYYVRRVKLLNQFSVYDANDNASFNAYNFSLDEGNGNRKNGYIIIPAGFRSPIVKDYQVDKVLPDNAERIYIFDSVLIMNGDDQYADLNGNGISANEFLELKSKAYSQYLKITDQELNENDLRRKQIVSQIIYLFSPEAEKYLGGDKSYKGETYEGQDGAGYGGIIDCEAYLEDRYGCSIITRSGFLISSCKPYTLSMLSETDDNNCTIGAITRLLCFHVRSNQLFLEQDEMQMYPKVKDVAINYGYTTEHGTNPLKINNIIQDTAAKYGRDIRSHGKYIWSYKNEIMDELDNAHMVVMNIARGYYGNHSVAIVGYYVYTVMQGTDILYYPMIAVFDGWEESIRYIDYVDFAYNYLYSGFGSFNTVYGSDIH